MSASMPVASQFDTVINPVLLTNATTTTATVSEPVVSLYLSVPFFLLTTVATVWLTTPSHLRAKSPELLLGAIRMFGYGIGYFCVAFIYVPLTVVHHVDKNWGVWPVWLWGPQPVKITPVMAAMKKRMRRNSVFVEDVSDFELDERDTDCLIPPVARNNKASLV